MCEYSKEEAWTHSDRKNILGLVRSHRISCFISSPILQLSRGCLYSELDGRYSLVFQRVSNGNQSYLLNIGSAFSLLDSCRGRNHRDILETRLAASSTVYFVFWVCNDLGSENRLWRTGSEKELPSLVCCSLYLWKLLILLPPSRALQNILQLFHNFFHSFPELCHKLHLGVLLHSVSAGNYVPKALFFLQFHNWVSNTPKAVCVQVRPRHLQKRSEVVVWIVPFLLIVCSSCICKLRSLDCLRGLFPEVQKEALLYL